MRWNRTSLERREGTTCQGSLVRRRELIVSVSGSKRLVQKLDDAAESRHAGRMPVAGVLAHLAFWDERTVVLVEP
jgi:hypothetical protein